MNKKEYMILVRNCTDDLIENKENKVIKEAYVVTATFKHVDKGSPFSLRF